jgi:ferredoxin
MSVLKAEVELCQGYANCVENAPSTFDLDADGTVMLLRDTVPDDERADIEQAVRSCPVSALSILEQ